MIQDFIECSFEVEATRWARFMPVAAKPFGPDACATLSRRGRGLGSQHGGSWREAEESEGRQRAPAQRCVATSDASTPAAPTQASTRSTTSQAVRDAERRGP